MQEVYMTEGLKGTASDTWHLHCCFTVCEDHYFHYFNNVCVSNL